MKTSLDPARSTCRLPGQAPNLSPRLPHSNPTPVRPAPRPRPHRDHAHRDLPSHAMNRLTRGWILILGLLLVQTVPLSALAQVYGSIDVWPQNSTVEIGGSRQFGAYVPISPNTVTWLVNDIPGGNPVLGTISATGLYQAPAVAPTNNVLTIKARSTAYPNTHKSTALTVTRPYPWLWSVSPASLQTGNFSVSFNGNNFAPDSVARANGVDLVTTYVSKTSLQAIGVAVTPGTIQFTVRQPGPGAVTGNVASATAVAPTITLALNPATASLDLGQSTTFTAIVGGTANTTVTWSIPGDPNQGSVSAAGVYSAPTTMPAASTVKVRATSNANASVFAEATVTLTEPPPLPGDPPPATPLLAAARIADQTSFGPNDALLATIQQLGLEGYLAQQFALPATPIPTPANNSVGTLQQWQLHTFTTAPDQLRQRMIYSLGHILVVSANKNIYANAMLPWMRALSQHAFGNYRDLLRDVTRSSSMGKYLDLANSTKPGLGGGANENYPRELLQLFTVGLWKLGSDGSTLLDSNNAPIPTYTQTDVAQLALALTGWVYAQPSGGQAYEWHGAPMVAAPQNHDFGPKTVLGVTIPAGQSVEADLEAALDILMNHPNTAPFVATRLIRSLVLSNPSAAYIQRVAQVFRDTDGNLQATLTAILTDVEARTDLPTPDSGRLKEPILHLCGFLRALNGHFKNPNQLVYLFENLAQSPLNPPSVFGWFSPLFPLPGLPLFGPEFQIYTPTEATLRGNFFHHILANPNSGDFVVDLSPYLALGNNLPALVDLVNQKLLHGRMPAAMKPVLVDAASPGYDAATRVQTVLYLTALSGQYAVQH